MFIKEQNHSAIRTFMTIMAERDAAIRERNMAIEERKRAFAERDMAMLQRDAALAEYNSALQERDEAMACLRSKGSSVNENNNMTPNFPGKVVGNGAKDIHHEQPELKYSPRETLTDDPIQITEVPFEAVKPRKIKVKHTKESKNNSGNLQVKIEDDSGMPIPVCSCTGAPQPCYKWGDGGWQSACCTTTMSHVSGRKMSGNSFGKLLNRLHDEGYDLSGPVDLKEYWGRYGTNR